MFVRGFQVELQGTNTNTNSPRTLRVWHRPHLLLRQERPRQRPNQRWTVCMEFCIRACASFESGRHMTLQGAHIHTHTRAHAQAAAASKDAGGIGALGEALKGMAGCRGSSVSKSEHMCTPERRANFAQPQRIHNHEQKRTHASIRTPLHKETQTRARARAHIHTHTYTHTGKGNATAGLKTVTKDMQTWRKVKFNPSWPQTSARIHAQSRSHLNPSTNRSSRGRAAAKARSNPRYGVSDLITCVFRSRN